MKITKSAVAICNYKPSVKTHLFLDYDVDNWIILVHPLMKP